MIPSHRQPTKVSVRLRVALLEYGCAVIQNSRENRDWLRHSIGSSRKIRVGWFGSSPVRKSSKDVMQSKPTVRLRVARKDRALKTASIAQRQRSTIEEMNTITFRILISSQLLISVLDDHKRAIPFERIRILLSVCWEWSLISVGIYRINSRGSSKYHLDIR